VSVVVVAGSEGLLGREFCSALAEEHQVLKLDLVLGHDLCEETFVKSWFRENRADYLVNAFAFNDHVYPLRPKANLFDITLASFDEYLRVNLTALFSVCREFARNNDRGGIVNFSATTGLVSARPDLYGGAHKHPGYCVSKGGVIQMSKYLAVHLAPGVRVNCLAPGGAAHDQPEEFQRMYASHTPMGRMMKTNELNGIVRYLCSEGSAYMTGACIVIDGGWTAW